MSQDQPPGIPWLRRTLAGAATRNLPWLVLGGALAGGVNALLCYAHWPTEIRLESGDEPLPWKATVILGGLGHGGLLGLVAGVAGVLLARIPRLFWILYLPPAAWVGGLLSMLALQYPALLWLDEPEATADLPLWQRILWPAAEDVHGSNVLVARYFDLEPDLPVIWLLSPLFAFGFVAALTAVVASLEIASPRHPLLLLALLSIAGIAGCQLWWQSLELALSLPGSPRGAGAGIDLEVSGLHGTIWGMCTTLGLLVGRHPGRGRLAAETPDT